VTGDAPAWRISGASRRASSLNLTITETMRRLDDLPALATRCARSAHVAAAGIEKVRVVSSHSTVTWFAVRRPGGAAECAVSHQSIIIVSFPVAWTRSPCQQKLIPDACRSK
jgi:hypothetical protein